MKKLLVLSGKGGTGKTTVSAAIIKLSKSKAVADCDVDAPNLHLVMEQNTTPEEFDFMGGNKAKVDLEKCIGCEICHKNCRFEAIDLKDKKAFINEFSCEGCGVCAFVCPTQAVSLSVDLAGKRKLYKTDRVFSTAILKMGRGNSGKLVTDVKKAMFKENIECDFSVTDGSPGIGCPVIASVSGMDIVLLVVEPSQSGISDMIRLVKTVDTFQIKLAVCINKFDTSIENTEQIEKYCELNNISFVGKIPFDKEAVKAVNSGYSIVDIDCMAGNAVREIYENIKSIKN